jgi:hypothetical protein
MKRHRRDLNASHAMILDMIGEMVKVIARNDERFVIPEARVDRIESRLNLQEHPQT